MYWVFIRDGVLPGFLVGGTGFFFLPSFHAAAKGSSHQVRHHQRKAGPFPGLVGRRTLFVFCFFLCFFFRPSFVSFGVFVFFWRPSAASSLFRVTNVRSGFLVRQYGVQ